MLWFGHVVISFVGCHDGALAQPPTNPTGGARPHVATTANDKVGGGSTVEMDRHRREPTRPRIANHWCGSPRKTELQNFETEFKKVEKNFFETEFKKLEKNLGTSLKKNLETSFKELKNNLRALHFKIDCVSYWLGGLMIFLFFGASYSYLQTTPPTTRVLSNRSRDTKRLESVSSASNVKDGKL